MTWEERAACRGADPELFFPDYSDRAAAARVIGQYCRGCPVIEECGLARPDRGQGIWGAEFYVVSGHATSWSAGTTCGTSGGYYEHAKRGQRACGPCAYVHREEQRQKTRPRREQAEDAEKVGA